MILVTGGAGFIGSVLVKELNKVGRKDIIIVDRLAKSAKWLNLRNLKYQEYINCDQFFSSPINWKKIEAIYHMGACSSTTERDVDYLMKNNFEYSKKLFLLATSYKIPIVYASSAATYGDGDSGYSDSHESVASLLPLNPYGYSKQLMDEWVLAQKKYPPFWAGVKFFNVYGPNEYHKGEMRSLVHKAFFQIGSTKKVKLFKSHRDGISDGEQKRDFVYVVDVVRAMIEMIKSGNAAQSGIYNLGAGHARSFKDLMLATFAAMKINPQIEFIDMPTELRDQYQYFTEAQMNKFFTTFPNVKFSSVEEGVSDYVINYLMKKNSHY